MKTRQWRKKTTFLMLLIFTLGVVLLPGCGGAKSDKPEDVVRAFGEAWKKKDLQAADKLMSEPSKDLKEGQNLKEQLMKEADMPAEAAESFEKAIFSATIEPGEAKIDGDTATVKTKVHAIDFDKIMEGLFSKIMTKVDISKPPSDEELNKLVVQMLQEELEKKDKAYKDSTVDVALVKKGSEWKIDTKKVDPFLTALIGMEGVLGSGDKEPAEGADKKAE